MWEIIARFAKKIDDSLQLNYSLILQKRSQNYFFPIFLSFIVGSKIDDGTALFRSIAQMDFLFRQYVCTTFFNGYCQTIYGRRVQNSMSKTRVIFLKGIRGISKSDKKSKRQFFKK